MRSLILPLLAACTSAEVVRDIQPPQPDTASTAGDTLLIEDTGIEDITGDGEPPAPEGDQTAQYFDLSTIHRADLTLSADAISSLGADPYTYVEADLTFDDEVLQPVAVRIKGRLGSYRDLSGKPALKVDLNRYHDQDLGGLERLNFNNMVQDSAMTHEVVAYALFNAAGVPAPRVGYVWVTINGDDYGLYSHVEVYDDTWLSRTYDDPTGNLYDGDYYLYPDWSYTFIDFDGTSEHLFALDEGEDVDQVDLLGVTAALNAGGDPYESLSTVVDMEQFLKMWATEAWLGHYDGYAYNDNNYRVYFDPSDGRARFHPWDPDWAFYSATPLTSPSGELAAACMAASSCRVRFAEAVDVVSELAKTVGLEETLDEAAALIEDAVAADPRKEYSTPSVTNAQNMQRSWLSTRDQDLMGYGL
ncbi:MAG: hypothetical protein ACI8RZ_007377 [Myxococcota bacterium]|jgi:hypothetical protein